MAILLIKIVKADVNGNETGTPITNIPPPSSYNWKKMDLSGKRAGRTEAFNMIKAKEKEARALELSWRGQSYAVAAQVLQALNHEYLWLTYYDFLTGQSERKHFYCGDMTVTSFTATNGGVTEIVSIQLIQARPDAV